MENENYVELDINELKRKESDLVNFLKFSDEHMRSLFNKQLGLAQELTDEKKINDDLRDRLMKIRISIEVKEQFNKQ